MKIFTSFICLFIGSATCSIGNPAVIVDQPEFVEDQPELIVDPPELIVDPPPELIVDPPPKDVPTYDLPPFESETTCYFFVPCFHFATEPICCLPKNGCGGAYTFANSCYLGTYNCEHGSNEYYEYRAGECPTKSRVQ